MLKLLKKLPFWRRYSTNQHATYWRGRTYGWEEYIKTWSHPHRSFLTSLLAQMPWVSLFEFGCGSGPNLVNITTNLNGRPMQLGGVDINPKAIEVAEKTFNHGHFRTGDAKDVLMSDKSVDVTLSDMFLIYIGPTKIKQYLKEMRRITRNYVVLCEYYDPSWFRRQWHRLVSGQHVYNYPALLEGLGYNDVVVVKVPRFEVDHDWRFRWVIIAKPPKRY